MGVTTLGPAATSESNCTILAAGYYAKQMRDGIVTQVAVCPQNFYCRCVCGLLLWLLLWQGADRMQTAAAAAG
jgi:hypothetical protein